MNLWISPCLFSSSEYVVFDQINQALVWRTILICLQAVRTRSYVLGSCLWEGPSRPARRSVLDASVQRCQAGQTCSAGKPHHWGSVERSPQGHQGWASPSKRKGRAWEALEGTDRQEQTTEGNGRCRSARRGGGRRITNGRSAPGVAPEPRGSANYF